MLENSRHGSRRDPKQIALLSLCMGLIGAILLAAISLVFDTPHMLILWGCWTGLFLAAILYRSWGKASCLSDIGIIFVSLVVVIGTILIRKGVCVWIQSNSPDIVSTCMLNWHNAVAFGVSFTVPLGVLPVWLAVHYAAWRTRHDSVSKED